MCYKYKIPMSMFAVKLKVRLRSLHLVPYSGGSSLEANFSAPYGGMSIDFSHMDQILALHADE